MPQVIAIQVSHSFAKKNIKLAIAGDHLAVTLITLSYPVKSLYTTYSKADDRALGKGVRLTQCPRCKHFADKYVEHDFVVLFIDLVLIKPQVYRHLLFNRLGRDDDHYDPSIVRLGILLLLFDVYLTWARVERNSSTSNSALPDPAPWLSQQPLLLQYIFFLVLCTASTLAFHLPIRLLCSYAPTFLSSRMSSPPNAQSQHDAPVKEKSWTLLPIFPRYPYHAPLSTALLVSSCTKLFPLLLIVWEYDLPSAASAVSWAVIVNNIAALEILMDCGYIRAALLVAVGAGVRATVGWTILRAVGIQYAHDGWIYWQEGSWARTGAAIGGW